MTSPSQRTTALMLVSIALSASVELSGTPGGHQKTIKSGNAASIMPPEAACAKAH
jgi:hypothetical protein